MSRRRVAGGLTTITILPYRGPWAWRIEIRNPVAAQRGFPPPRASAPMAADRGSPTVHMLMWTSGCRCRRHCRLGWWLLAHPTFFLYLTSGGARQPAAASRHAVFANRQSPSFLSVSSLADLAYKEAIYLTSPSRPTPESAYHCDCMAPAGLSGLDPAAQSSASCQPAAAEANRPKYGARNRVATFCNRN